MKTIIYLIVVFALVLPTGCVPVLDFTTAKTIGKGYVAVTPNITYGVNIQTGANFEYGLTEKTDLKVNYVYGLPFIFESYHYMSISTKFGIIPEKSAINLQVAYISVLNIQTNIELFEEDNCLIFQPSYILTRKLKNSNNTLTFIPKLNFIYALDDRITPTSNNILILPNANIGFSFKSKNGMISIRPEINLPSFNFGLGITLH